MIPTRSLPEVEEEIERIAVYLDGRADGDEVHWSVLATATGITMNTRGRDLTRRALARRRRPYEAVRGVGLRLSSAGSAMTIMRDRFVRIDGAVRVAEKTQRQLQDRHLDQLAPDDQRRMLTMAGFFGAIRAFAKDARGKLFK